MNQDQVLGALRVVVPALLAYAAGKGWLTPAQVSSIVSALPDIAAVIVLVGGTTMSILAHTNAAKVTSVATLPPSDVTAAMANVSSADKLNIVAAMPEVRTVLTTKALAEATPSPKVTA